MFLSYMVVNIPVLEVKSFSMDFACPNMESIINSGIFLYGTNCTVDLVLPLSVLMFLSDIGSCSSAACVFCFDGTICCFRSPVRMPCPNYEAVEFQPRTVDNSAP